MPFTLDDLANIDAQIASGVSSITENGNTITFGRLKELRALIVAELTAEGALPARSRVTLVERAPEFGCYRDRWRW